jgi:MarR family transcriptional regulator for hemolysin
MSEIREIWLHAHNMIRTARQIINENLHPLNLSSAEGNILLHLWTQGHEMGQDQLVEQLDVSKPAVSRTIDSLEKKGYIARQPNPDDKRAHQIRLTRRALEAGPAIEQIYNHIYTLAMQGISAEEFDYFVKLFERISENFAHEQAKREGKYQNAA